MIVVTLYSKRDDPAAESVKQMLASLQATTPHQLVEMYIDDDRAMYERLNGRTPLVEVGPYVVQGEITLDRLQITLGAAHDRRVQMEKADEEGYRKKLDRGRKLSGSDRLSLWVSNYYIHVFNLVLFIYLGGAFLAPVLMENNSLGLANILYKIYSPVCHQLPFRSWFLFGEQAYYPRELAGIPNVITWEQIAGTNDLDLFKAREFVGNPTLGFKMALCERDVALYGSMLLFGIVFWLTGRRIRPIPLLLWVMVGVLPIGLDGFSQLPGVIQNAPAWLPIRESSPLLRTVTGLLFGGLTTWYLYPLIEITMGETRRLVMRKMAVIRGMEQQS